jgi:hypothetical protein
MEMTRHRCTVCISSELKPGSQPFLFLFRCRQLEYYHQWFIIATQMIIGGSLHFSICQKNYSSLCITLPTSHTDSAHLRTI